MYNMYNMYNTTTVSLFHICFCEVRQAQGLACPDKRYGALHGDVLAIVTFVIKTYVLFV